MRDRDAEIASGVRWQHAGQIRRTEERLRDLTAEVEALRAEVEALRGAVRKIAWRRPQRSLW